MKAKIKNIHSPDIEDLESYIPDDQSCFSFLMQLMIGPDGQEGEESFDVEVCTPNWISKNYPNDEVVLGRHKLIVLEYDFIQIKSYLDKYVETIIGKDWNELAFKLSRLGRWEFEDYYES